MTAISRSLVLGLGASGAAAARLLRNEGASVTIVDAADAAVLEPHMRGLVDLGVEVIAGCDALPGGEFDVAVVSPGIAEGSPWVRALRRREIRVISELELGWTRRRCPVIAVTGSNGKSTAVKLLAHALQRAGRRAAPAGNYGLPVSAAVTQDADWLVLEVSSFQLELVDSFRPEIGILLNVQPNHLDRHGTMERYHALKSRLFARTEPQDLCLVQDALLESVRAACAGSGRWEAFGASGDARYRYRDGAVYVEGRKRIDLASTAFANPYAGAAAAAVLAALERAGVTDAELAAAVDTFEPLPHRMQRVGSREGITFVNDSKSTCLSATAAALEMCDGPVRLIAGGIVKESDLSIVRDALRGRASAVYLIGDAASRLADAWGREAPCRVCETLDDAVRSAWHESQAGETLLLSPGCASFDQFSGFAERGNRFMDWVREILRAEGSDGACKTRANAMDNHRTLSTIDE